MQDSSLTLPAPAKLNLFLHVTGRRADGYHTLESLMVLLDFGDTLTLACREDAGIVLTHPLPGVPVEADLTYRAARLLQAHAGVTSGATITLIKRIPLGAGLGGGSSDAASVLLGMNRLWNLDLSRAELMRIGLQLGADVPFFILGFNAHVAGIGEILRPVTIPRLVYMIAVPPLHVATADIFAAPTLNRQTPASGADAFALDFGRNDLQAVAAGRHGAIAAALAVLDQADFGRTGRAARTFARMSGSGSCVFRIVDGGFRNGGTGSRAAAERQHDDLKFPQGIDSRDPGSHDAAGTQTGGPRLISARGLHYHPLREFAAK